jgi:hypothetical protein
LKPVVGHEGRTGEVCAGGQYDNYHQSRTGEVACGGQYDNYRRSRTGEVCFGGLYRPVGIAELGQRF